MSFIDQNLLPGERILVKTHPHWSIFFFPGVWVFISLICFQSRFYLSDIGYLFLAIAAATGGMALISYTCSEFSVTNKRVIAKHGLFSRHTVGVLHDKVESVDVRQTLIGRLIGFGTVIVTGTGGTQDLIRHIPEPFLFRRTIQSAGIQQS